MKVPKKTTLKSKKRITKRCFMSKEDIAQSVALNNPSEPNIVVIVTVVSLNMTIIVLGLELALDKRITLFSTGS